MRRIKNAILVFLIAVTMLLGLLTNSKPASACGGDPGTGWCPCPQQPC